MTTISDNSSNYHQKTGRDVPDSHRAADLSVAQERPGSNDSRSSATVTPILSAEPSPVAPPPGDGLALSVSSKKCYGCGEIKPLSCFDRRSDHPERRRSRCSKCRSQKRRSQHRGKEWTPREQFDPQAEFTKENIGSFIDVTDRGCWEWKGTRNRGYGQKQYRDEKYAHRAVWTLFNGTIPEGLQVLHHCDNPPCVNPDHLFLGTDMDNKRDAMSKCRHAHGETNGFAKLTDEMVVEMRTLAAQGMPGSKIAERYNVSYRTMIKAVRGETWKHIVEGRAS